MTGRRSTLASRCSAVAVVVAAALGASCDRATGPAFPANATPFVAPALYASWWRATEQCADLQADFSRIRWYTVPDLMVDDRGPYDGVFYSDGNRIVLYEGVRRDGRVVRHEMLHALGSLSAQRHTGHPRPLFHERCGGVVSCAGDCAREAGTDRGFSVPAGTLKPAELELSLAMSVRETSATRDSGWVTFTVAARNPRAQAMTVVIPTGPLGSGPPVFGARVERWGPMAVVLNGFPPLEAGETRRWVFEAKLRDLAPGRYHVRGAFVRDSTAPDTLTVLP